MNPEIHDNVSFANELPRLEGPAFDAVPLNLKVTFRFSREEDVPLLEWFGLFSKDREVFNEVFASQRRGENLMLLAIANRVPIGQVWIDLKKHADGSAALIWALRVIPWLQGLKLGTKLLHAAEQLILEAGFAFAELEVEKNNPDARRLYERCGYKLAGESTETGRWVLRKKLQTTPAPKVQRKRLRQAVELATTA
jgi:GNAT superfamily N-acetyltransferase